jgi:hypothetical protein
MHRKRCPKGVDSCTKISRLGGPGTSEISGISSPFCEVGANDKSAVQISAYVSNNIKAYCSGLHHVGFTVVISCLPLAQFRNPV